MIQQEENHFVQDTTVITLDQSIKLATGHVTSGERVKK